MMAVVKANGYGHGMLEAVKILEAEQAEHFAVAILEEGIYLRQNGCEKSILILGHTFDEGLEEALFYGLTPTIDTYEQAKCLNKIAQRQSKVAAIHIKIDTGMGRLGFLPNEQAIERIQQIFALPYIRVEGIYSHLASSEQIADATYSHKQFNTFSRFLHCLEEKHVKIPLKHLSNSAAIMLYPEMHFNMVRPGTALFGIYSGPELRRQKPDALIPAMSIKARLARVRQVPAGTKVSYSSLFETARPSTLGVVPLGYADGIFRSLANKGEVLLHGKRSPIVGNLCMDQFVIDISHVHNPNPGDEIVLVGTQDEEKISAEEVAEIAGTNAIELLTGLGERMPIKML